MTEEDLRLAVAPVHEHFRGKELSVNTVLAAHLRAAGLRAIGDPWLIAKSAVASGFGFDEAVRHARAMVGGADSEPEEKPAVSDAEERTATQTPRRAVPVDIVHSDGTMQWYPKAFGQGDLDGVGARRLLGQPSLDRTHLLVREMAQNSWDARDSSGHVEFTLNLRKLTHRESVALRTQVLTGSQPGLGLTQLLGRDEIWCLEVSDRGTVGLDGPTRSDKSLKPGTARNFIDLVFNIGAPRDTHLGGGTYGFGKTISYVISSVDTVVIWSRCRHKGALEHRLIGSAMGDSFDLASNRYTGRAWWGSINTSEDRVEPMVGDEAQVLAETIFESRFEDMQTGTSFLILDPVLTGDTPNERATKLRDAVVENLWPKLLADQQQRDRMSFEVLLNGRPVPLPSIEGNPTYSEYAECLQAVRAVQSGKSRVEDFEPPMKVVEIRSQRPKALLGHLAMRRAMCPPNTEEPEHAVALMRHQAELLVKYWDLRKLEVPGFEWVGVFKPTDAVDDSYAAAEPPAHDDWVPASIEDRTRKTHVNVGLREIKKAVEDFLAPASTESADAGPQAPLAHVGDMLAGLVGMAPGAAPSARSVKKSSGASRGKGTTKPSVAVTEIDFGASESGFAMTILTLEVSNTEGKRTAVEVKPKVAVDGGSFGDGAVIRVLGFSKNRHGPWEDCPHEVSADQLVYFAYQYSDDLAVDVETIIKAV